ncbi:MAG: hypothetical protein KGZ81_03520 [Flavobacteriales bacterium]|nr:hypothetical protein [Flavobacteriales bacterium]
MIKNLFIFWFFIFIINLSCDNKSESKIIKKDTTRVVNDMIINLENKIDEKEDTEKEWLVNFYKNYISFYINSPNRLNKAKLPLFFKQLDSIKKKHCTESFYLKQKENEIVSDFDYITNNEFLCTQSLNSLEVFKKINENDVYIVSFIAEYPKNENESEYKKISFEATVINNNGVYKISKTCCF